jgi:TPR repeat protein
MSAAGLAGLLQRLALLEEQVQRHEEELAICLGRSQVGGDVSGVDRLVKAEQLYREGQELIWGERHVVKDISRGMYLLRESASLGHPDSVFALGFYLRDGEVYPGNPEASARYYRASALEGNSWGQVKYGYCLEWGLGTERVEAEAATYYKLSADQGNSDGECRYGYCLEFGKGTARVATDAAKYYKLSADQGNPDGEWRYGYCLESGIGTAKVVTEAAKYYKRSADQGYATGQFRYGLFLENGWGLAKNVPDALKYYKLAADQGNAGARERYGRLQNA